MPLTESGPRLAYTLIGPEGADAIVFVNGLGGVRAAYVLQDKAFRRDHRVLTYDQRGLGQSDPLTEADLVGVTMADYAADLVRLLDEAGIERASFVGLSFGGRVLQELAVGWPERVERLVLGGTSCGGALHFPGDPDAHAALRDAPDLDEDGWVERVVPALFGRRYVERHPERVRMFARWRVRYPSDPLGLESQWRAYEIFDACERLRAIAAPTLILHGTDDRLSMTANARTLARRIPDARLVLLDDLGHAPNVEDPVRFEAEIRAFLAKDI